MGSNERKRSPFSFLRTPFATNFFYSATAASTAVLFTNPFDVAKTRLQLQGELIEAGKGKRVYAGPIDCIVKTMRIEGVRGVQRGLTTAIAREAALNFFRIGMFAPVLKFYHPHEGPAPIYIKIAAGITTGSTAALICNPLDIMKTRMQAQASGKNSAVGYQHSFSGVLNGFKRLLSQEGILGLWKGVSPSVLRLALGSSGQLASYTEIKEHALAQGYKDGPMLHIGTSFISVIFGVTAMNPVDVVRTRIYNQPAKKEMRLYKSAFDAAFKMLKYEGPQAFFKGWFAHYLRGAPHVALIFVFFGTAEKEKANREVLWRLKVILENFFKRGQTTYVLVQI